MSNNRKTAAFGWVALASFLFALMYVFPKLAAAYPASEFQDSVAITALHVALFRYLGGVLTITPVFFLGPGAADRRRQPFRLIDGFHVLRALMGVMSVAAGAYAVLRIPLANAQAISATSGVIGIGLAVIFLRERIDWRGILAILVSLSGAIIVAEPRFDAIGGGAELWFSAGAIAAFISAFAWGVDSIILKFSASRDDPVRILMVVNYAAVFCLLCATPFYWTPISGTAIALLAAMGPIAIVGQYCNIRGFQLAASVDLVAIRYSGVVFAALIGVAIFNEWPTIAVMIGGFLVCGGAVAALTLRSRNET
ncbi:MAG: drug/metabolite transporter (DMT)-like permease [Alphaproteobacteria bacterium]